MIPVSDKKLVRLNDVGQCERKMRGTVAGFAARHAWCRQKMFGSLARRRKGLDDSMFLVCFCLGESWLNRRDIWYMFAFVLAF